MRYSQLKFLMRMSECPPIKGKFLRSMLTITNLLNVHHDRVVCEDASRRTSSLAAFRGSVMNDKTYIYWNA